MSENETPEKTLQMTLTQTVESPLPLSSEIEGYERILPGAADRILTLVEKQSQHRQEQEKRELEIESRNTLFGLIFAFVFSMSVLVGTVILVLNEHPEAAAIFGAGGIGTIAGAFLRNRKKDSE